MHIEKLHNHEIISIFVPKWYIQKNKAMLVVSSREFRENQKSYLDKIDNGIEVLIQRGKSKSYKIVPVMADDTLMSKEEFFAKLDRSIQQAKAGKVTKVKSIEELNSFLDSL